MPLKKGFSQEVIEYNIKELTKENQNRINRGEKPRSHKQIVAIALNNAKKYKKTHQKKLTEAFIEFLNDFKQHYPIEVNTIIESFQVCFENDLEINLNIPENAKIEDIKELRELTNKTLNDAEKMIELKNKTNEELNKTINELKKKVENLKNE